MSLLTDTTQRCRNACLAVHVCMWRLETKSNNSSFRPLNLMSETFFSLFFFSIVQLKQQLPASQEWPAQVPSIHLLGQARAPPTASGPTIGVWQPGPAGAGGEDQLGGRAQGRHSWRACSWHHTLCHVTRNCSGAVWKSINLNDSVYSYVTYLFII